MFRFAVLSLMKMNAATDPAGGGGGGADGGGADFLSSLPQEYREKSYMKTVDSLDSLLKQFDGAQNLLGKKSLIPGEGATDEEWNKYYDSVGRPKDGNGYEFDKVEFPKGLERPEEMTTKIKDIFHKAGLTPKQAKAVMANYDQLTIESLKKMEGDKATKAQAADAEFENLAKETFGDKKEQILNASKELLAAHMPEKFKPHLEKLDNTSLVVLSSVLNTLKEKYISDGTGGSGDPRGAAKEIMATEAYRDGSHPGHKAAVEKVDALYASIPKKK
jgi:hypothetical protein